MSVVEQIQGLNVTHPTPPTYKFPKILINAEHFMYRESLTIITGNTRDLFDMI
jgi:hypothetical protein